MDDLTLLYYRARQLLPISFFATRGISHLNSNQTDWCVQICYFLFALDHPLLLFACVF